MTKRLFYTAACLFLSMLGVAQTATNSNAKKWADSVINTLSPDEQIAQLMVVRLSSIDFRTKTISYYDDQVANLIKQYNIGGICLNVPPAS